jgi:xanthine dehydrogenase accessory factor
MGTFARIIEAIEAEGSAALVSLAKVEGSSPREPGAHMVVRPSLGFHGTIGGGALEWQALAAAGAALKAGRGPALRRSLALGPELAQCCGGRVAWRIETFDARDLEGLAALAAAEARGPLETIAWFCEDGRVARKPAGSRASAERARSATGDAWLETFGRDERSVFLFGAGHVGRALALALAPLPFALTWIDSRRDALPARAPANARLVHSEAPPEELSRAPDGALVLVMTHDHALDLSIVVEALREQRFAYVGLIGSATKRARFVRRMRDAGLAETAIARLVCPIGIAGVEGKEPAVIAAATAAQLLQVAGQGVEAEGNAGGAEWELSELSL